MNCAEAKRLLSSYIDSAMTGKQMHAVSNHLEECERCREEVSLLSVTQRAVSALGRKQAPPDLSLKIRVMMSQQLAAARRDPWEAILMRWRNATNAFMVPATAGMLSAVIIFGLLIGMLMPVQLSASNDVPTNLYIPPELSSSPFVPEVSGTDGAYVIEAYVDASGRVHDFRILAGPDDAQARMPEIKNMMLFTVFRPATSFGQPTSGRAILTFSGISVKG
ncbi:MAG TPA: zf-HC2 domain-containing protein [Clostridia bacterium]|nr:zf-HC2 domain-containing protein [Clostridia bacterium]